MCGVTVLLYNLENEKRQKIEKFCRSMALNPVHVAKDDFNIPIENLLEKHENVSDGKEESTDAEFFSEEMMVFCGFNGKLLDIFLREYKKRHMEPVSLKAMLTEHNRKWTSAQLYGELCRERAAFTKR